MNTSSPQDMLSDRNNIHLPFVITLNRSQYEFYKSDRIQIQSPDGKYLESIGLYIHDYEKETRTLKVHDQIQLVENLLAKMTNGIEVSAIAVEGLVDLLYEMQGFCGKYIK